MIVYDSADDLSPDVVAKFIPPGNRGNVLIIVTNSSFCFYFVDTFLCLHMFSFLWTFVFDYTFILFTSY